MYQNVETCILEVNITKIGIKLPVDIVYCVRQGCATFITEGPNTIKQIRPRTAPSFHIGCLVLVTSIKMHFVVLHLARGPLVAQPWCKVFTPTHKALYFTYASQ